MSKIDDLIKQHCPNGVEYRTLGEVVDLEKGKQLNKSLLSKIGKYPAYNGGVSYSGFTDTYNYEENKIIISQGGASAGFVNFITTKFYANAHCYIILPKVKFVENRYVYHFLKLNQGKLTQQQHGAGIPALRTGEILDLPIPIPPLPVQSEIVKILDNFTELEAELAAELEAELKARKKQYEYYRDQLLSFEDTQVEWKTLGEVACYSKDRITTGVINESTYVGVDNLLQNKQGKINSNYVPKNGNLTQYTPGDVLIGNIRPYLKKIWLATNIGGTNGDVLVIRIMENFKEKMKPDFLYYLLASDAFFEHNMQYAKGAKMPRGNKDAILKYGVPIPPLEEQARIVAILDKFNTLTSSITEGLPREIELREKQYKYYRNKLLTFPKKAYC